MILDLDAQCWAHVSTALMLHRRWCRENAIPVPDDVARLGDHAKRVTERHTTPDVHSGAADAHAAFMSRPLTATTAEVARRLNVSKRTVQRLVAAGSLPSVKVGGVRRVRLSDLEAYVASLAPRPASFRDAIVTKESA